MTLLVIERVFRLSSFRHGVREKKKNEIASFEETGIYKDMHNDNNAQSKEAE
jgi:hypothetical protein